MRYKWRGVGVKITKNRLTGFGMFFNPEKISRVFAMIPGVKNIPESGLAHEGKCYR